jgi:PAS domain S-box-containing protein
MLKSRTQNNYKKRIDTIHNLILEIASGNFEARGEISSDQDDLDAITAGINMLVEELKESTVSRDYLDSIYTSIVDMVIILDAEGNIKSVNSELEKTLGYTSRELIEQPFSVLFYRNSRRLGSIFRKIEENSSFHSIEKVFQTKQGKKIYITCSGSALYDKQRNQQGILCIARDISKIKKFEQDLLDKNKEMDQFVYKASHDIKGPLVSIIGLTNLAISEIKDADSVRYLSMINKTATRLNKTLMGLLNLAITEKTRKEVKEIRVLDTSQEIIDTLKHKEGFSEIAFKVIIDENLVVRTNEIVFNSVIQNLRDNAIKYRSRKDPMVEIRAGKTGKGIEYSVKDNGIGIPHEFQSKIFEMFFRATQKSEGTGLGLYIVKNSIEKMGGEIKVKSAPGKGTQFTVFLPNLTMPRKRQS